jgi:hypothetical protein
VPVISSSAMPVITPFITQEVLVMVRMHKNHTDYGVKYKCPLLVIAILEYIGILNCYPVNQLRMVKLNLTI